MKRKLTESQVNNIMAKMTDLINAQMRVIEEELLKEIEETLHLWLNQDVDSDDDNSLII